MKWMLVIVALVVVGFLVFKPSGTIRCVDKDGKAVRSKVACDQAGFLTPEQHAADPAQRPRAETPPSRPGPQRPSNPQVPAANVESAPMAPLDAREDRVAVFAALAERLQCRVPDVPQRLAGHLSQMLSIASEPLAIAPGGAPPGSAIAPADCGGVAVRNGVRSAVISFYQGPSDEVPEILREPIR